MTKQEWERICAYHHAAKRRPIWRGTSKRQAKNERIATRKRNNPNKVLLISIDARPWMF